MISSLLILPFFAKAFRMSLRMSFLSRFAESGWLGASLLLNFDLAMVKIFGCYSSQLLEMDKSSNSAVAVACKRNVPQANVPPEGSLILISKVVDLG